MVLLSIDPDTKNPGWALFVDKTLVACGIIIGEPRAKGVEAWARLSKSAAELELPEVDLFVYEVPSVYKGGGEANNIMELSSSLGAIVGVFVARFPDATHKGYSPSVWKGQMKKEVHHEAVILPSLTKEEAKILTKVTKRYNKNIGLDIIDAVGLGLYAVGRRPCKIITDLP